MKKKLKLLIVVVLILSSVIIGYRIIISRQSEKTNIQKTKYQHALDLMKQEKYSKASKLLREVVEENSEQMNVIIGAHAWLHMCYKRQGLEAKVTANARSAIAMFRELFQKHPEEYHLSCRIAAQYFVVQDWENARKRFQEYIEAEAAAEEKQPFLRAKTHMKIAEICENEGKWSEMVQEYQKILADLENPYKVLKAEAQYSIAEAYRIHGVEIFGTVEKAKSEAFKAYQKVIALFPEREYTEWREKAEERITQLRETSKN